VRRNNINQSKLLLSHQALALIECMLKSPQGPPKRMNFLAPVAKGSSTQLRGTATILSRDTSTMSPMGVPRDTPETAGYTTYIIKYSMGITSKMNGILVNGERFEEGLSNS
jgi:hypothetical protein